MKILYFCFFFLTFAIVANGQLGYIINGPGELSRANLAGGYFPSYQGGFSAYPGSGVPEMISDGVPGLQRSSIPLFPPAGVPGLQFKYQKPHIPYSNVEELTDRMKNGIGGVTLIRTAKKNIILRKDHESYKCPHKIINAGGTLRCSSGPFIRFTMHSLKEACSSDNVLLYNNRVCIGYPSSHSQLRYQRGKCVSSDMTPTRELSIGMYKLICRQNPWDMVYTYYPDKTQRNFVILPNPLLNCKRQVAHKCDFQLPLGYRKYGRCSGSPCPLESRLQQLMPNIQLSQLLVPPHATAQPPQIVAPVPSTPQSIMQPSQMLVPAHSTSEPMSICRLLHQICGQAHSSILPYYPQMPIQIGNSGLLQIPNHIMYPIPGIGNGGISEGIQRSLTHLPFPVSVGTGGPLLGDTSILPSNGSTPILSISNEELPLEENIEQPIVSSTNSEIGDKPPIGTSLETKE